MLQCQKCKASLAISTDGVSQTIMDKLFAAYKKRLGTAHKESCIWHRSKGVPDSESSIIPVYMASMLDSDYVSTVEVADPLPELQKRAGSFSENIPDLTKIDDDIMQKATDKVGEGTSGRLALTGWHFADGKIECKVCLAQLRTRSHEPKRARQEVDPLKAHRYYCPYVCGNEPVWKHLANKLLSEERDESLVIQPGEDVLDKVRRLLTKGISSKSLVVD